jgi:hypothetical protein
MRQPHSLLRFGLASLIGGLASFVAVGQAEAASTCDPASLTCAVGTAPAMTAKITKKLATEIDSGWMEKGPIKVRTRFTIDPAGGDPLASIGMNKGALVEASWPEKGYLSVRPLTGDDAEGAMSIHYTLTPSLEANIYGIGVAYDASTLVNHIPGASFDYDSQGSAALVPWGFTGTDVKPSVPALSQSTIFSIDFADMGISSGIAEGTLSIQAAAKPVFTYKTKSVRIDSGSVDAADGTAKILVDDADAVDLTAYVSGEVALSGSLDVKPVVVVDSVDGYPTFGLTKFSFSAVTKDIGGSAPTPVTFDRADVHIPLPNVKVPSQPLDMGSADAGGKSERHVTITSTGEMAGLVTVESSNPDFVVPTGKIQIASKSTYDLKIVFQPSSGGPASADITVRSNDPDSPEQVFHVAANGAALDPGDPDGDATEDDGDDGEGAIDAPESMDSSGCSAAPAGRASAPGLGALGVGLGLAVLVRRRRRAAAR